MQNKINEFEFSKKILKGHKGKVTDLCFSLDGIFLFSSGGDGRIIRWNIWQGIIVSTYLVKNSGLIYSQVFVLWNKSKKLSKLPSKMKRSFSLIEKINISIPQLIEKNTIRQELNNLRIEVEKENIIL